jgi:hypothetical protein
VSNSANGEPAFEECLDPELRGQFSLFSRLVVSRPVDVGVGVAGALVELERRKPMGGGDSGYEVVGGDGGIGDALGDAFCWNRECKQVGFGDWGSHVYGQCDLGFPEGLKGWADGGGSSGVCGWLDGKVDVGEKAVEECPPDEEWSTAAGWVVTAELDGIEE